MNFDELVPGATVRFTVIDGVQYMSVRDLIMALCRQNNKHASTTWANLADDKKSEVSKFLGNFRFPGPGQKDQPVITFPGAIKLMMWLPGENAKQMRSKAAEILTRYFAGDPSLLEDIQANAASASPISQAARAALQQPNLEQALQDAGLSEESLAKRRKLTDEFTGSIEVSSARVRQYTADLSECNAVFERHIELKERSNNVDIKYEHDKLSVERAKLALLSDSRRQELEWKRACREFGADPAPTNTTTVLKVYEANKQSFPGLTLKLRKQLVLRAGLVAAQLYREKFGAEPSKKSEGDYEVNTYPLDATETILQGLRTAYRCIRAGDAQLSIGEAFNRLRVPTQ